MASSIGDKIEPLARVGYAARGIIYLIVGGLALLAAVGQGGRTTGSKGALTSLMSQPFGQVMLGIVAAGLVGYSVWRFVQAVWDADGHGTDLKGWLVRGGLLVSAGTHAALAFFCASILFGIGGGGSKSYVAWLLGLPMGQWLVAAVRVAVIGAGVANIVKGVTAKYKKRFDMDRQGMRWAAPLCTFGLVARGVAFLIVGGLIIAAGVQVEPDKAQGLAAALDALHRQPYGPYLLGTLALGLLAFGLYSGIAAVFRRIG